MVVASVAFLIPELNDGPVLHTAARTVAAVRQANKVWIPLMFMASLGNSCRSVLLFPVSLEKR